MNKHNKKQRQTKLKIASKPLPTDVIELGIDTVGKDNDDAKCRYGVKPNYKKKKNVSQACRIL